MSKTSIVGLQDEWNTMYRKTLPELAKNKSSMQPKWPVVLDHCFARIILDNVVGIDRPWTQVLKSPAYKNMTEDQLKAAIDVGEKIMKGEVNLVELDEKSLMFRGKKSKVSLSTKIRTKGSNDKKEEEEEVKEENNTQKLCTKDEDVVSKQTPSKKRRAIADPETASSPSIKRVQKDTTISTYFPSKSHSRRSANTLTCNDLTTTASDPAANDSEVADLSIQQARDLISTDTNLTPFRKLVLSLLTKVPRGKYTTYAAISNHITSSKTSLNKESSGKCSPRAVGNAMRNNPYAPIVPCHRVIASDGRIGGFGGEWGEEGKYANEKKKLLRDEGVKFDGKGKVIGSVFHDFASVST